MSIFMIDVESDGPIPGPDDYSMVCFGAVLVDKNFTFKETFYGETAPISTKWEPEALAISGFTRDQHETFEDPETTMRAFKEWVLTVNERRRPIFLADNNGYDFAFSHFYLEHFLGTGQDPFGWSSRNLTDIYHGLTGDMWSSFKHLRRAPHNHDPRSDALGNAQAFQYMVQKMGLNIK